MYILVHGEREVSFLAHCVPIFYSIRISRKLLVLICTFSRVTGVMSAQDRCRRLIDEGITSRGGGRGGSRTN